MRTDSYFDSNGKGRIHCIRWTPEGTPRAIVQIVHGIAEYAQRYSEFASFLNSLGYLVVAEDHMGHGLSIAGGSTQGHFHGGWFSAIEDTCQLTRNTMAEFPGVPYILFGHSMGSFMARTILCKYPDLGLTAAVICGTSWQPRAALPALVAFCNAICNSVGAENISTSLQNLVFGGYNKRIDSPKTESDWLSKDEAVVHAYVTDPLCGFIPTTGLVRDMMVGIRYMEQGENLNRMKKDLPVLIIGGGEDPVGYYGKSIYKTAKEFRKVGMLDVTEHVFPGDRHEILNETDKNEVFSFVSEWISSKIK